MANGNGNGNGTAQLSGNGWTMILPVGALGLLGALLLSVQKDASVALDVARQHGEEILLLRSEIHSMESQMRERTQLRYTSKDAERDFSYLRRDIAECKEAIKLHDGEHERDR